MNVTDVLARRFDRAGQLYLDLVDALDSLGSGQLGARLADVPSDRIGDQLWCVLGARESYPRAARAGSWQGFTSPVDRDQVTDAGVLRAALVHA